MENNQHQDPNNKKEGKITINYGKAHEFIKEYNSLINLIAFFVALAAIGFSYSQTKNLQLLGGNLNSLSDSLNIQMESVLEINSKIPTQTISAFPGNLATITKEIINIEEPPKSELLICTDVLIYGFYQTIVDFRSMKKT